MAARLSGTADGTDGTLHGVAVWATSFLVSAVLLGNLLAGVASTATTNASGILGGLARGAGSVVSTAGEQIANRTSTETVQSTTQSLIDRAQNALSGGGDPAAMNSDQRKAEIASLVRRRITDGNLPAPDRERLNTLVAAEFGIPPQEAQQRVDRLEQQAKQAAEQAEQRAREAADATAKAAAWTSFAVFMTMLLGMSAAISDQGGALVRRSRSGRQYEPANAVSLLDFARQLQRTIWQRALKRRRLLHGCSKPGVDLLWCRQDRRHSLKSTVLPLASIF